MPQIVAGFWNSPDQLSTALRWITFIGITLVALSGAAAYLVSDRIATLQNETIALQSARIQRQDSRIGSLTAGLTAAKSMEEQLTRRALDAERGVSETYDFNGALRENVGGRHGITIGRETAVFHRMEELQNERDWSGLEQICERQIQATPRWLTPYLFSGVALANLFEVQQAKQRLEYVVQQAGDDPAYADAPKMLAKLTAINP